MVNHILKYMSLIFAASVCASCSTLEMGTALALARLDATDIDPRHGRVAVLWPDTITEHRPPHLSIDAAKDGEEQIDTLFKLDYDPAAKAYIPLPAGYAQEQLSVYKVADADMATALRAQNIMQDYMNTSGLFSRTDWTYNYLVDLSFTLTTDAFNAYCKDDTPLDISIWVKTDKQSNFRKLVKQKDLDRFLFGLLDEGCQPGAETPNFVRG